MWKPMALLVILASIFHAAIAAVVAQTPIGGTFTLSSSLYVIGEDGSVQVWVRREGGDRGRQVVQIQSFNGAGDTAAPNTDYVPIPASTQVVFPDGSSDPRLVEIQAIDNNSFDLTQYYKSFSVSISLIGGEANAVIGALNSATVRIYDHGDGVSSVSSSFNLVSGVSSNTDGWTVVGNGNNPSWVDVHGLYSSDQTVGLADYVESCDFEDQVPCVGDCEFGGKMNIPGGHAPGLLQLKGLPTGYVRSVASSIIGFTGTSISVSFWVQTSDRSGNGALLSYATPNGIKNAFTIYNPTALSVVIGRGSVGTGQSPGLRTKIDIADGKWHHLIITWRSADGRVLVYKDGMETFVGGPYRSGYKIPKDSGSLVIGQAQTAPCDNTQCFIDAGRSFNGLIQHFRLWNKELSASDAHDNMKIPYTGQRGADLLVEWRFDAGSNTDVIDTSGGIGTNRNAGKISSGGVDYVPGWPTTRKLLDCNAVYGHRWYFAAPSKFGGNMLKYKGGRMQFRLMSPNHSGSYRNVKNGFILQNSAGLRIGYNLQGLLDQGASWRSYVVPLSLTGGEGWTYEDSRTAVSSADFDAVLSDVRKMLILGDIWTYSTEGFGTEMVYLNDVKLYFADGVLHL